ncbi:MAG: head-tail adaptor protein [Planktotalea sp.]
MQAGRLNKKVKFYSNAGDVSDHGNWVDGRALRCTLWANVREQLGKEKLEAGILESKHRATIRVRRSALSEEIETGDTAQLGEQDWKILSIAPVGDRGDDLDILCETAGAG